MKTFIKVATALILLGITISFSAQATTVDAWVSGILTISESSSPPANHTYTYYAWFTIEYRDNSSPTGPFTLGSWDYSQIPTNLNWGPTKITVTYFPPEYSYYRIKYYIRKDDYCSDCTPQHVYTDRYGYSNWIPIVYSAGNYYLDFPSVVVDF